tara:strand:+ start:824 stop:997 length:174 start_codon:yes stop_codon:yes gene_type:complete
MIINHPDSPNITKQFIIKDKNGQEIARVLVGWLSTAVDLNDGNSVENLADIHNVSEC